MSSRYEVGSLSNLSEPGLGFISLCVPVKMLGFRVFGFCKDVSLVCLEDGSKFSALGQEFHLLAFQVFFLKSLSHGVKILKFKLANVEFGHKK